MRFKESNTAEQMFLDILAPARSAEPFIRHEALTRWRRRLANRPKP